MRGRETKGDNQSISLYKDRSQKEREDMKETSTRREKEET